MKFTVVSNDYFDAPECTIEFRIVRRTVEGTSDSNLFLEQIAHARRASAVVKAGIDVGTARIIWAQQELNLRKTILRYGNK
ncbi:hypothetical protein [uncultured Leifsonia sp.]|uniref:hypothetical protein n=1 Tax=uncultured Leifsonia sp. TaxID=340359 RepID=UPI0028D050D1|nr:hypothetical protein [uncultured Leifsonia sp.]